MSFIEANQKRPFFCYIPFNTHHSPMMVPDRFYAKFADKDLDMRHRDPTREDIWMTRAALAMCENIDWNVGRILRQLDELALRENTIVIYFSDNGPNSYCWNGGMKGRKGSIDEGGLPSPFFIRWPNHIRAGMSITQVAGAIDLLPTLCDLAGVQMSSSKPLDGRSFRALLLEEDAEWKPRLLFAVKGNQVSVRTQRFRLDANIKFAFENHSGDLRSEELLDLIKETGTDTCGSFFDPGNAVWTMEDPMRALQRLGEHIICTSVRDVMVWEAEDGAVYQWTAVGEGLMDYRFYTNFMAEKCPGVPLHVESISNSQRPIPFLNPDFWNGFQDLRASDISDFLRLIRRGRPMEISEPPEGTDQRTFAIESQQSELQESLR